MSHGGFTASSKLLQKKWNQKTYQAHRQKMTSVKSSLAEYMSQSAPHPHLVLKIKKVQQEEQKQARVDYENQLLIQRMTKIMRSRGNIDNWNEYATKSTNEKRREKARERIAEQNLELARRLTQVKSKYDTKEMENDYQKHSAIQERWANMTKDYPTSSPSPRKTSGNDYESDFEDPDDESTQQERLPKVESQASSTSGSQPGRKKNPPVTKLPNIDSKKSQRNAAEDDAKLLRKATTKSGDVSEVILKTLIKKSHQQRMATRNRFGELYDCSLEDELKGSGSEYDPLVECLLAEREVRDANTVNTFIHDNDVTSLINLFCSRNQSAIKAINTAYTDAYDASIEEDTTNRILDETCQTFIMVIYKCDKSKGEPNMELVDEDAHQLSEGPQGRFRDPDGKLFELFRCRHLSHIKAVLNSHKSGGDTLASAMEQDGCSKEFIEAVQTFLKCVNSGAMLNVEKIRELIKAGNTKELISLLLARAEIDMPAIRTSYRKKYGIQLKDDIVSKCGRNVGPLIAHIVFKQGKPAKATNKASAAKKSK